MAFLNPSTILCKYFAAGKCKKADCYFSHDPQSQPRNVCRYFQLGICFAGDNCRFDHIPVASAEVFEVPEVQPVKSAIIMTKPPGMESQRGPRTRSTTQAAASSSKAAKTTPTVETRVPKSSKKRTSKRLHVEAGDGATDEMMTSTVAVGGVARVTLPPLCPIGRCKACNLIDCPFRHGDYCHTCQCYALDPLDPQQRHNHEKDCLMNFEEDMERAFALQRSEELQCNVCLDIVMQQNDEAKRRFGVLEGCSHVFCFSCIMLWRRQPAEEEAVLKRNRTCPTCRVHSHFVFPAKIWPDTKEDKERFIADVRKAIAKKPCIKYNQGKGRCLFGNQCWYLHALPDGTVVQLAAPVTRGRRLGSGHAHLDDFFFDSDDATDVDSYLDDDDAELYMDMVDFADQLVSADLHNLFGLAPPPPP